MKKIVFFLLAILEVAVGYGQKGIHFEDENIPLNEIFQKARKENKIIFFDCYTSWCGPCKWMAKNVFPNDTIGDFYNSNFVCVSLNMEKEKGKEFAKLFEINCYPTFIFADSSKKLIHRKSGKYSVQKFVELGREALTPEKQFCFLKGKYDAGNISQQELVSYMRLRKGSGLGIREQREKYFSAQTEAEYLNDMNWIVMRDFGVELHSPAFEYLFLNRDTFDLLHTVDSVNKVIKKSYQSAMRKCYWGEKIDTLAYVNLKLELINSNFPFSQSLISACDAEFRRRVDYLGWLEKKEKKRNRKK